jgi:hypothetical protein
MIILGTDPGNVNSAFILYDSDKQLILDKSIVDNQTLLDFIATLTGEVDVAIIEKIACMGMAVGESVMDTAMWSGRFCQRFTDSGIKVEWLKRIEIKNILCGSSRAKDANIRQRLIDIFTVDGINPIGTKKNPGRLYKVHADEWSALATVISWIEKKK